MRIEAHARPREILFVLCEAAEDIQPDDVLQIPVTAVPVAVISSVVQAQEWVNARINRRFFVALELDRMPDD